MSESSSCKYHNLSRLFGSSHICSVLLSLSTVFFSLSRVSGSIQAITKAMLAACEFFSVIDTPLPERGWLKDPEVYATEDIVFDKVTFAYPSRPDIKILDQLDLCIEAGKITAIVGFSGSGKNTIVGLVQRWYTLSQQQVIAKATQRNSDEKSKEDQRVEGDNFGPNGVELQESGAPVVLQSVVPLVVIRWTTSIKIGGGHRSDLFNI